MNHLPDYLIVGLAATLGSYLVCFPVRWLVVKVGITVQPDQRRIHSNVMPSAGGIGMFLSFLVAMILASQLGDFTTMFKHSSEPLGTVIGAAAIFAVGLIDDLREMSAPAKVAGQVLAAMALYFLGVTMFWFKIPFAGFVVLSSSLSPLITALWVIVIVNAVNLIDGLDGLAAGIVAIASGSLFIYGIRLMDLGVLPQDNIGPLIAVIACGVCVGFLPHNFNPAKIIMGDAGSMFLGLLMAVSTMVIGGRTPDVSGETYFFFAPLFIPFFILGVPILDTVFAVVRRTAKRSGIAKPDKEHLHHRLLRLGHGPRRAVIILWGWTAVLSALVLYPTFDPRWDVALPFVGGALALLLYVMFLPGMKKGENSAVGGVVDDKAEKSGDTETMDTTVRR